MSTSRNLYIASDHAGFELKEALKKAHPEIQWVDLGTDSTESVHYPDFSSKLAKKMLSERSPEELLEPCGVLVCGSGVGVSMGANRHPGVRAVLAHLEEAAVLSRQHNASNVLCLGARLQSPQEASTILGAWLRTPFEGGRHQNRIELLDQ